MLMTMKRTISGLVLFVLTAVLASCGGLSPDDVPPRAILTGNVEFVGGPEAWPDTNVFDVRVVAFEDQPTEVDSILGAILSGKAVISDGLPLRVSQTLYSVTTPEPPRTFKYVVVAMQNADDIHRGPGEEVQEALLRWLYEQ